MLEALASSPCNRYPGFLEDAIEGNMDWHYLERKEPIQIDFDLYMEGSFTPEQKEASNDAKLGIMYLKGLDVVQNLAEANICFRRAAKVGHKLAYFYIGLLAEQKAKKAGQEYSKGMIKLCGVLADKDYAPALCKLGFMIEKYDPYTAFMCFKKAAKKGNKFALCKLGFFYLHGLKKEEGWALKPDIKVAHKFLALSAKDGCLVATYKLFSIYRDGLFGFAKSSVKAEFLKKKLRDSCN